MGVLAVLPALPESEIKRIPLAAGAIAGFSLIHLLDVTVRYFPVFRVRPNRKVDVSPGRVSMPALHQLLDQVLDGTDRLAGQRFVVGPPQPQSVRISHVRR